MKVSRAANIVSTDLSANLQFLVDHENYHCYFKSTAWFIQQVAKWFTLMTSRNPVTLSKFNLEKYNETIQFLNDLKYVEYVGLREHGNHDKLVFY